MIDDTQGDEESCPEPQKDNVAKTCTSAITANSPSRADVKVEPTAETDLSTLTPEEQMARFEEQLKEDDWGHQPC